MSFFDGFSDGMDSGPICIVCGAGYVSGKEIMALELGRGMRRQGHGVSFVTSHWNNGDFQKRLKAAGVAFAVLPIGFISATLKWDPIRMTAEQIWRWPGLILGYAILLYRERPARVVHTNWHHLLLLAPFLRCERDVFWLHECVPDKPQYRRLFLWFERRLRGFVCVSRAVANSLRKIGVSDAKIRVIHNGMADPASGTSIATTAVPQTNERFRIGIVGQIGSWKGHEDLLEALAQIRKTLKHAEVHVFGAGQANHIERLKNLSRALGVFDSVRWHGFVEDRKSIYSNLDVCVVPSRFEEPFGLSALEPAFFSLPVIATRRGGLPEIVEHEVTGLLVNAGSPTQIAEALERLAGDSTLRRALGKRARVSALERFSADRFIKEFDSFLESGV